MKLFLDVVETIVSRHVATEQVCRTCAQQAYKSRIHCEINKYDEQPRFVVADGTKFKPVAGRGNDAPNLIRKPVKGDNDSVVAVAITRRPAKAKVAELATCGQSLLGKCLNCQRFVPVTVKVPHRNAGGNTYGREEIVGGHCSLPKEGIVKNGYVVFCDPVAKDYDGFGDKHNCSTCRFSTQHWESSQLDHVSPLIFDLSPYENYLANQLADRDEVGIMIGRFRTLKGQRSVRRGPYTKGTEMAYSGLTRYFKATIVEVRHGQSVTPPVAQAVTLTIGTGDMAAEARLVVTAHPPIAPKPRLPALDPISTVAIYTRSESRRFQTGGFLTGEATYAYDPYWVTIPVWADSVGKDTNGVEKIPEPVSGHMPISLDPTDSDVVLAEAYDVPLQPQPPTPPLMLAPVTTKTVDTSYLVRFANASGNIVELAADNVDDTTGVVTRTGPDSVVVAIHSPYHLERYGIVADDTALRVRYPTKPCPRCLGTGVHDALVENAQGEMVIEPTGCGDCGGAARMPWDGPYKPIFGSGKVTVVSPRKMVESIDHRVEPDPGCLICDQARAARTTKWRTKRTIAAKEGRACYYHAKMPFTRQENVWSADGLDEDGNPVGRTLPTLVEYWASPSGRVITEVPTVARRLRLLREPDEAVLVVDDDNDAPDVVLFRLRLRSILAWCHNDEEKAAVQAQLRAAEAGLTRYRVYPNLGLKPASEDPYHVFCSLNAYDQHPLLLPGPAFEVRPDFTTYDKTVESTARGINFFRAWNDAFGTPRSSMSSSVVTGYDGGYIEMLPIAVAPDANGVLQPVKRDGHYVVDPTSTVRAKLYQGLRRDPMVSAPLVDARSEWLRTTNTGARLQEEQRINHALLREGRNPHTGCSVCDGFFGADRLEAKASSRAQWDALIAAHGHWTLNRDEATVVSLRPGLPGTAITAESVWRFLARASRYDGSDPILAAQADKVAVFLAETKENPVFDTRAIAFYHGLSTEIVGSPRDGIPSFWTDMHSRLYGFGDGGSGSASRDKKKHAGAKRISGSDLVSVAAWLDNPHPDEDKAENEVAQLYVCSVCFDPNAEDFEPLRIDEIKDASMACPDHECHGTLVLYTKQPKSGEEWNTVIMQMDADQLATWEPYRRKGGPELAEAPDTAGWLSRQRLMNTSCEHWTAKRRSN